MYVYLAKFMTVCKQKLKLDVNVLPREIQNIVGNEYYFQTCSRDLEN